MSTLTTDRLRQLAAHTAEPAISLYLPTHRYGPEIAQDRIRLKNLIGAAIDELVELGHRRPDAEALTQPARALLDRDAFWQHQADGLAVLLSPEGMETLTLPARVEERAVVSNRFMVRPLLPALDRVGALLVAFSRSSVRLFRVTLTGIVPQGADLPASIDDTAWFADREAQLQHHAAGRGSSPAAFHGHDPEQQETEDLRRFLAAVAQGVDQARSETTLPVLVAAVDELAAGYRRHADHPVADATIPGNPDERSPDELAGAAREMLQSRLEGLIRDAEDRITAAVASGNGTRRLEELIEAAAAGRVAEVIIDGDTHRWAAADAGPAGAHPDRRPGDDDLLDRVVSLSLRHGGDAWMAASATDPIAASFRF